MTDTAPPPAAPVPLGPWERLSDRLNPILVREVQQAMKGRMFAVSLMLAIGITLLIAVTTAANHHADGRTGLHAFNAGFATLMPLCLFVVPMQAYQSMRLELRGGIVEQLLVSRLRPMHILAGKLQAAMVQFVLFVAIVAPTLATSYLLRGVDLPTIALSLGFAALGCAAATMLAISSAAQARTAATQALANIGTAFGLGIGSFSMVGLVLSGGYAEGLSEMLRSREFWAVLSAILLVVTYGGLLAALAARAFLLHAFENRATPFRVALFASPLLAFAWVWVTVDASDREEALAVLSYCAVLQTIVFGYFMVTEQQPLSPRVAAHAPRSGLLARVSAPWLPGRDRGYLCFLLALVLPSLMALALSFGSTRGFLRTFGNVFGLTIGYGIVYLALGRWLRAKLPDTLPGNHMARVLLPVLVVAFIVVPVLCDVFLRGSVEGWHWGHAMNPFWTISEHVRIFSAAPPVPTALSLGFFTVLVLQVPTIVRGVAEVASAARARRERGDQDRAA